MWNLLGTRAVWTDPLLAGEVNVANPSNGVALKAVAGAVPSEDFRFFKVLPVSRDSAQTLLESYVRGRDLVATYEPLPGDKVQPQVYWRALGDGPHAGGMELVISTQTSLLDSDPSFAVAGELPAGDVLVLNGEGERWQPAAGRTAYSSGPEACGAFLLRPSHHRRTYFEAVFPSDYVSTELSHTGEHLLLRQRLFTERLEKGVIRRGRLCAWLLPRDGDEAEALARYREFCLSAPPLTT